MSQPHEHLHAAESRIQTPNPEEAKRMAESLRSQGAVNVRVDGNVVIIARVDSDPDTKF